MIIGPHFPPMKSKGGLKPKLSHCRGSVLGSPLFLTQTVPLRAPLVSLCLSFLSCACAVTLAPLEIYQENRWNNVCKVFLFVRMKRAITTKSKRYWRTFLTCNHFCFWTGEPQGGSKGCHWLLNAALGASSLHLAGTPRVRSSMSVNQISRQVVQCFPEHLQ